jgi:hypothetical protein
MSTWELGVNVVLNMVFLLSIDIKFHTIKLISNGVTE